MANTQRLIAEIRRLYLLPGQQHHAQDATGDAYFPAGDLTAAVLDKHLSGELTAALNLVSDDSLVRALVVDFDGVAHGKGLAHWEALARLANHLQADLGLPAPGVAVSGRKGWGLWISLEQPVPAAQAQQFLRLLRSVYLREINRDEIDLRPDTDRPTRAAQAVAKLPPCLHRASGLWAAFINPGLGASFVEEAGLPVAPSPDGQAELLASLQSVTPEQFQQALHKLQQARPGFTAHTAQPRVEPAFSKAEKGYLPPCIRSLVDFGVPHEMQFNMANLNLAKFCDSAGMDESEAVELAQQVAAASEDHPSSKDSTTKVRNFRTSLGTGQPFQCDYPRNIAAWSAQFGGLNACAGCKVNPGVAADKQTSHQQTTEPVLEDSVALDLLAHARDNKHSLPQIRSVWPEQQIQGDAAPFFRLAAQALERGLASAAFFGEVDKHLSEKRIYISRHDAWRTEAQSFFSRVQAHQVTEQAGLAALHRAVHLERRFTLADAARRALKQGSEVAANVVAMELRGAAEASLKAEQGAGPLASLRDDLFRGLARTDSVVVPTPFPRLNGLLHGGLRGGRLYTLLAPPKSGKTTCAAAILDHAAAQGNPCLYVGYEMGREQMVEYALARRESINSRRIETRDLSEEEALRLAASLDAYLAQTGQYLEIWEAGMTTSIADMAAWVTRVRAQHPDKTPLVVIDYLQLAYTGIPEIDRHPSETKRVSEVAVACKHLARQTGAAVLALSSVTKAAETDSRLSGEIDVTAARDSLAIIHASDGVLALQTATMRVSEGKGDDKTETEVDPWGFLASQLRLQSRDAEAVTLERALSKLAAEGYSQNGFPGCGVRARLSLLRHRGSTGDVALYYRQAFHSMEEVALPGLPALEAGNHRSEISRSVFQKYAEAYGEAVFQDPLPGFEATGPSADSAQAAAQAAVVFEHLTEHAQAVAAIGTLRGVVGIDLETTGLSPLSAQARLLQLSDGQRTLVIDLWKAGGLAAFRAALEPLHLVAHNAVFEMGFLYRAGIEVTPDCTMLAHHVLTGKRASLKALAAEYLGQDLSKEQQTSDWSQPVLTEQQLGYAAVDALVVAALFPILEAALHQRDSTRAYLITRDAQPCITRMELAGMGFDAARQQQLLAGLTTQRDGHLARLAEALEGRNPASGTQLAEWLTQQLGGESSPKFAAWPKTPTGKLKTGGSDLEAGLVYLPDAAAAVVREALLPFKDAEKKISAFGASLADKIDPSTQRIHADFNLAGTETGRMSCSKPNLQQIPRDKEFRALFAAPPGRVFVICDYSQMELRVAAQIAGEETLIEAYRQGQDTHRKTAALLLGIEPAAVTKEQRQLAKAVNFGLLFGQGARGLQAYAASSYGVEISEAQARKYRDAWFAAYPAFKTWHNKSGRAAEKALAVRTPAGRERRWLTRKEFAVTAAFNTPVQGGAAEAMLAALAHLDKALRGIDAVPIAVVHDEVIVECAQADAAVVQGLLEQAMTQGFQDIFPQAPLVGVVEANVCGTWADK